MRSLLVATMLISFLMLSGCAHFQKQTGTPLDYRTVSPNKFTSTARAERLYRKSLGFIEAEGYDFAEQCLQKALLADISYGPAHNALGKVYYAQKKYYLAAWEFEHAAETLPSRAEPLNNLGLVYEAVDKFGEAIGYYQEAVSLKPESSEYLGNLLRVRVRNGESVASMRPELESLLEIEDRVDWCDWTRKLLAIGRNSYEESSYPSANGEEFCPPEFDGTPIAPQAGHEVLDSNDYWKVDDPVVGNDTEDSEWEFPDSGTSRIVAPTQEPTIESVFE